MACEMIGADKVSTFITNSGKKKFRIRGSNEGSKVTPRYQSTEGDAVENFNKWAALVSESNDEYSITCFDSDTEDESTSNKGGDRKSGSVKTYFRLNAPIARPVAQLGAPAPQTGVLTEARLIEILSGRQQPVDINAAIENAINKTAHKYEIAALNDKMSFMTQSFTSQLADMRDEQIEMMEEEEAEEKENKMAAATIEAKKVEMEGYERLMKMGQVIIGEAKSIVYEFMGKNTSARQIGAPNMAVNGPTVAEAAVGWQPTINDQVGTLPPYLPQGQVNVEDQKAKAHWVIDKMLVEANDVTGDDLLAMYKLFKDMPTKFAEAIQSLRTNAPLKTK